MKQYAHYFLHMERSMMHITDGHNRFTYLSLQQAFQALTGVVGGLVAGTLPGVLAAAAGDGRGDASFYRSVLAIMPVVFVVAFFTLFRARPVSAAASRHGSVPYADNTAIAVRVRFPWQVFVVYPLVVYLAIVGDYGARTFFNLYLRDLGLNTQQIGSMFGFNQLAPFITALAIPSILNRLGTGRTFSAGAILLGAVLLFLSLTSGLGAAGVGFFLMALMSTVLQATRSLFGQELVDARWRTFIASTGTISMSLGSASSSMLGGAIIPTLGFASLFRVSAVIVCLSGLLTLVYLRFAGRKPAVVAVAVGKAHPIP